MIDILFFYNWRREALRSNGRNDTERALKRYLAERVGDKNKLGKGDAIVYLRYAFKRLGSRD